MKLNKILSGFNKTLKQLEDLMEANRTQIEANDKKVTELETESAALFDESLQADHIANNIKKLVGGTGE